MGLVVVGLAQVVILVVQYRQHRLELAASFWRRWSDSQAAWATVVYIGRRSGEYYQVAERARLRELQHLTEQASPLEPSMWALQSVSAIAGLLSDVCLQILGGHLNVADAYAVFGTSFLRQCRPLRSLMDPERNGRSKDEGRHGDLQTEVQDWLIYHDGLRRRCLILIDLLWAEAARLEDLPPADLRRAAWAKQKTGHLNRRRVFRECLRLGGITSVLRALYLGDFLRYGEFRRPLRLVGLRGKRLDNLEKPWVSRLLRAPEGASATEEA